MLKKFVVLAQAMLCSLSCFAYHFNERFETEHYAIYEIVLERGESYDMELKKDISRDIAVRGKLQTTAAVFKENSKGFAGGIKEPLLGIVTAENYAQNRNFNFSYIDDANAASLAGIYLNQEIIAKIIDTRNLNKLLAEFKELPLIINNLEVSDVSRDFRKNTHLVHNSRQLLLDFEAVDSVFYTKSEYQRIKEKCKVSVLAFVDRQVPNTPFYMAAHGAVNDIKCN